MLKLCSFLDKDRIDCYFVLFFFFFWGGGGTEARGGGGNKVKN